MINKLLELYWSWKLNKIKRDGCIIGGPHPYPPDTETGWRKLRKDYRLLKGIKNILSKINLGEIQPVEEKEKNNL